MNARSEGESYKCLMMNYETKRFDDVAPKWKLVLCLGWINYLILTLSHRMSFNFEPLTSFGEMSKHKFLSCSNSFTLVKFYTRRDFDCSEANDREKTLRRN